MILGCINDVYRGEFMVSAVALIYESRMQKLVAHIILPTRFSTSKSDIYHGGRCICIISALTHQICQLGKPLGAAVVRKPKQITLRLTPRRHTKATCHTISHQGIATLCHQGTPRRHHTLAHQGTPRHHQGKLPYNLHIQLSSYPRGS